MRHYIRINKQINLPLSLEAEDYLEEHSLRDDVVHWRDNYCVIFNEKDEYFNGSINHKNLISLDN
jgi:hypothetical protein